MKVNLICSDIDREGIIDILKLKQISIDESASVNLVERNKLLPEKGIIIIFDPANLSELIKFLDCFTQPLSKRKEIEILTGKQENIFKVLHPDKIYYFVANGNYVYCQTKDNKFEVKKKLYELGSDLANKGFIRVNKSHVINIMKVKEIIPWFGGRLLLTFQGIEDEIEVSRRYVGAFKEFLGF